MPKFSTKSKNRLNTCDWRLRAIFNEVIKKWDCSILCGHRNEVDQNNAYRMGRTKVKFPQSKHNKTPSRAVDVAPYPIDWHDLGRFYMFAGYVLRVADQLNFKIRFGGDWNRNTRTKDQRFNDLPHFEIL